MSRISNSQAVVIAAIIGVVGIVVGAIANPLAKKLIDSPVVPDTPESLAIEQISHDVFAYAGNNNPAGGAATFVLIDDDENVPNYKLDYSLPSDKYGYAGLAFNFHGSVNLSEYSAIECIIIFSQPINQIDLYFKDISDTFNTIRVVSNGESEMTIRYEFKNFPRINFNAVKEVGIVASTDFSTGTYQTIVKSIRFIK